nr:Uncharacterised protein [Klebsiella pneumoniae]
MRERAAAAAPASEPPQVDYTIVAAGDAVKLDLSIAFSCRAERSFSSYPCEICFNSRP